MVSTLMKIINNLLDFLLPRYCTTCGQRLATGEQWICTHCLSHLHLTHAESIEENPIEKLFWVTVPIERATSFFYYEGENTRFILYQLKYWNNPEIGTYLAELYSRQILPTGFFDTVDVIIPLPLYRSRQILRGYNQSYYICKGISRATSLPIDTKVVKRCVNTKSQTHLNHFERKDNVKGAFRLVNPDRIAGRHVLLVDDVITTGATTTECAMELAKAPGVKISVFSLAYAGGKWVEGQRQV